MTLIELIALCHKKNDLNRRRRRFYSYVRHPNKPFSKRQAKVGYNNAKKDMKTLTPTMKQGCKEHNATLCWSNHGAISGVWIFNKEDPRDTKFIDKGLFHEYALMIDVENILLGDKV